MGDEQKKRRDTGEAIQVGYALKANDGGYITEYGDGKICKVPDLSYADIFKTVEEAEEFSREKWLDGYCKVVRVTFKFKKRKIS